MRHLGGAEDYAGNLLSPTLLDELEAAAPREDARVARLEDDPRPAQVRLPGSPLWRASEPRADEALQEALAEWIASCAG